MARKTVNQNIKKEMLVCARKLLISEGIEGLDVRKICKESGCSVGTFYNHYRSVDELILHLNGDTLDLMKVLIFENITPEDDAKEIIRKICQSYIAFAKNNHSEWLLIMEYPIKSDIPDWYQKNVDHIFQKAYTIFYPILRSEKKQAEKAVKILWGALHGICSLTLKNKLRFKSEQDPLELTQEIMNNYIIGYRVGLKL